MKFYLFFLKKKPKELYAFTMDKSIKENFEFQRNMDLFLVEKVELDKYLGMVFMNKNKDKMIHKDILNDGEQDYEIYATVFESTSLSESCEYINSTCQSIRDIIHQYSVKKKYLKSILFLTDVIKIENKVPTLKINTFKLFYEIFKETFFETENIEI